jgi:hypothetical protein
LKAVEDVLIGQVGGVEWLDALLGAGCRCSDCAYVNQ